jgi:amino acid adenylation domain-containing protein
LVIGTPVANRPRVELEGLIGFFVNTLALRVQLEDELSVAALVRRVKELTLTAYGHQEVPFEQVVEALQPPRSLSQSPLFQVMLVLQNAPSSELRLSGLSLAAQELPSAAAFDLALMLTEVGPRIVGSFTYASDLFDRSTIERWVEHFQAVLNAMVADANQRISEIGLLTDRERRRVLETFNATQAAYPSDKLIHELFEAQVERTPDAVAVEYEAQHLTYAQLNARANQLAHYLHERGVGPDRLVGLCVERSLEMVVGLLGILKAGGAYVPLDPSHPAERLEYMLQDAAPELVLTQAKLKSELALGNRLLFAVDEQWHEIEHRSQNNLAARTLNVSAQNLAYVIYTSGSTGRPKGVMTEHGPIVNRLSWMQRQYELEQSDKVLQKTPFTFDVSVWEFLWTLLTGARLVIAPPRAHQDPTSIAQLIERSGATTVHFVPSMLKMFLERDIGDQCATLRRIICSGEELPMAVQDECLDQLPQVDLHNLYGPTEAAIDVTFWKCSRTASSRVPIGRPIANTRMYILDAHQQPVPIGASLSDGRCGSLASRWRDRISGAQR